MYFKSMTSVEILDYYRSISTETFTVIDLETTGGQGYRDRIIEISVLQATLKDGIKQISTDLINPQIQIPEQIQRFTGISQTMVDGLPDSREILPKYLSLLQNGILTAHNFKFDYSFLQAEYRRMGIDFSVKSQLCTVAFSRHMLSHLPSRSLPNLVKHFGFKVGKSHRAESDAIACWFLLEKLLLQIQNTDEREILIAIGQEWLTQKEIAAIIKLPFSKLESILADTSIKSRFSEHKQVTVYQRGSVENLIEAAKKELIVQLSLPL
jgi:DNA polymerase III subunit epsilon